MAFLVLFVVVAFGTYVLDNWRRPVGFTWDRVWDVEVAANTTAAAAARTSAASPTAARPA